MPKRNGNGSNGSNGGNGHRDRGRVGMAVEERGKRVSRSGRTPGRRPTGRGTLVIIGGHEDKEGDKLILREVVRLTGSGRLVVATLATEDPAGMYEEYERIFRTLGAPHVYHFQIESREEALQEGALRVFEDATCVFFTGGDQLRITSMVGDTPVYERLRQIYESGGVIAGTSAGASMMSETMMVSGSGKESHKVGGALHMAPGLGFIEGVLIDQHFAERGRIGRLLGAVAQNPRIVGIGIDEDTAIVVKRQRTFQVIGSGAIYVLDGRRVSYSNIGEEESDRAMSVFDVKLHVLSQGDIFDLRNRRVRSLPAEAVERLLEKMEGRELRATKRTKSAAAKERNDGEDDDSGAEDEE
jgi:cyanophycinase